MSGYCQVWASVLHRTCRWKVSLCYVVHKVHPLSETAYPFQGHGGAGADPSWHWAVTYILPVHQRAAVKGQTTIHAHGHTYGQFRINDKPNFARLWIVGGSRSARREPTETRGEHADRITLPQPGLEPRSFWLLSNSAKHRAACT